MMITVPIMVQVMVTGVAISMAVMAHMATIWEATITGAIWATCAVITVTAARSAIITKANLVMQGIAEIATGGKGQKMKFHPGLEMMMQNAEGRFPRSA